MLIEAVCLAAVIRSRSVRIVAQILIGFIVPASLYRLAGTFLGATHCPCLGSLAGWWPWLAANQTAVLNTIAAWMFLSAVMVLARNPSANQSGEGVVVA